MENNIPSIAGIIIAAGESKRLGRPKQLIEWRGKTLIQHTIEVVEKSGVDPIVVVLGSKKEIIKHQINNPKIKIVINDIWKNGKGSSIRKGIDVLPSSVEATFIFVVDQPYLSENLIRRMMEIYRVGGNKIVAPFVGEVQTNPVLFDRSLFDELRELKDEMGGKEIIKKYQALHLNWDDPQLLIDIDNEEDVNLMNS